MWIIGLELDPDPKEAVKETERMFSGEADSCSWGKVPIMTACFQQLYMPTVNKNDQKRDKLPLFSKRC